MDGSSSQAGIDPFDPAAPDNAVGMRPPGTVDLLIGDPLVPVIEQRMSIAIAGPASASHESARQGRGLFQMWPTTGTLHMESSGSGDRIAIASMVVLRRWTR